jgi:glycosyltransferase involved in cell wall biosynthesis
MTLPPQWGGGGYTQTMGLCKHLRQRGGFEIRVAYPDPGNLNGRTKGFVKGCPEVFLHDVEGFSYYAIRSAFPAIEFRRYAFNRIWDELLSWADSAQVTGGGIAQGFPAARSQTPYALWIASTREADGAEFYRGSSFLRKRWLQVQFHFIRKLERKTVRNASRVFVISEYTRKLLENTYGLNIDPRDFVAVPVDADVFKPDDTVSKQYTTICYAGRVDDPRKQVTLLLAALRRVREKGIECFLKLAGEKPGPLLQELVRRLGLEQWVDFLGHLPSAELPRFYQSSLFSVLPSQEEGQGIVVLEAMACGLPVVATRCGGPESLIRDGQDGFLVANGEEEELAERMEFLIKRPEVALAMGQKARQSVLLRFTPEQAYSRIVAFHLALSQRARNLKRPGLEPQQAGLSKGLGSYVRQDYPRT